MRLYVCEKPSQGRDIARVLGASQRQNGYYTGPNLVVTWCVGHLVEASAPDTYDKQYRSWRIEHLPIIPDRWQVEVKPATATQFKIVQRLIGDAQEVVVATDADREGEMIARELLELCRYRGPVYRLWLSALDDSSIRKALGALRPGSETLPLYHAALARSRADWIVGLNLTRLFTILGRKAGYDGVLSVGRVQTPTLSLVVNRDREIANFTPIPYWSVELTLFFGGHPFAAHWIPPRNSVDGGGRCVDQLAAQAAAARIQTEGVAEVVSVETERVRELPPLPFDLSTLLQVCSRQLGLDVQETQDIAQSLYEGHKAITYPRTDSGYLPESMLAEVPAVLRALLAADPSLKSVIESLYVAQRSRAWNDSKIGAHHGIIPTLQPANLTAMSDKERSVYGLIRAHYLAQFLPVHEYDRTTVLLACAAQQLRAVGRHVAVNGWRIVLIHQKTESDDQDGKPDTQVLPPVAIGHRCPIKHVQLKALKTKPPKPYSQGELIQAMKRIGIGTEATRAGTVQALIGRGYLPKSGKNVRASAAAFTLHDAVPAAVRDPGTTAIWEKALDRIAAGELTFQDFVRQQSEFVAKLVRDHSNATLKVPCAPSPTCPDCNSAMRARKGKHGSFWSCARYPDCTGTRPMEEGTAHRQRTARTGSRRTRR